MDARFPDPIFGPFQRRPIAVFVGLAFGISWVTFALRPVLLGPDGSSPVLTWILKFGPSLAGLIAAAWFGGRTGLVSLARGLLRFRVPLRYYAIILRGIFLKGVGIDVLWPQALALGAFGVSFLALAALRFQKRI